MSPEKIPENGLPTKEQSLFLCSRGCYKPRKQISGEVSGSCCNPFASLCDLQLADDGKSGSTGFSASRIFSPI
jgi:hypothetical protein